MELIKGIRYDITTGKTEEFEEWVEMPTPIDPLIIKRQQEINSRLEEIIDELSKSDYKTLKYIEGDLSEEEFIAHKEFKNALRLEYNTLETELVSLIAVSDLPL